MGKFAVGLFICCVFILLSSNFISAQKIGDPYKILGINRKASLPEIRRAYKQLAKEWHPDKNEDPIAETRFVEIKQAYELLCDSERRKAYDNYGITNEDEHLYKQRHDYSQYKRFSMDTLDELFGFNGARFKYQDQDITLFHKLSITTRHFENNILEKSTHTPAIVLFYSDWCLECVQAGPSWRKLVELLQPLGVAAATVHAAHEHVLSRKVGVHSIPCLVFILDRHVYVYKESLTSIPRIIEFIRWRLPYKLVRNVYDTNVDKFLSGYEDNKVRGLIFEDRPNIRLRYLITAYRYRDRVTFGFVDMTSPDTNNVTARYKVERNIDTMVLLKEDSSKPAATVSMADIPTPTLHQLIEANQFLTLPRLSSQSVLDLVCPVEWRPAQRRLCCVLVAGRGGGARAGLRRLAATPPHSPERVRYAYIYNDMQPQFLSALAAGSGDDMVHRIVVIWRRDTTRVQYEWLNETWPDCGRSDCPEEDYSADPEELAQIIQYQQKLNETKQALEQLIRRLLKPTEVLSYEAQVKELVDEAAKGAAWRAILGFLEWGERAAEAIRGEHALPALSVLGSALLVLGLGYLMAYLVRIEEESVQRQRAERRRQKGATEAGKPNVADGTNTILPPSSELRLHELRTEKFNGLVRLLKPGFRTIVLLVDMQSRVQLLSKFHRIVWPYRKNKTLFFAHLLLERNLDWYRKLLQQSLPEQRELRINARNCVGTVLSLNGHRKYFCMFHAKHPESTRGNKRMSRMTRSLGSANKRDPEAGAFIGFESEPDSSDSDNFDTASPSILLEENLLDGLDNWLDRLFEGSTHRYYVNYWPDMTSK